MGRRECFADMGEKEKAKGGEKVKEGWVRKRGGGRTRAERR